MEETGDVLLVGEEPGEPAQAKQAKLEGAVAPAAALREQGPPAALEHPLRQGGDPQGSTRWPEPVPAGGARPVRGGAPGCAATASQSSSGRGRVPLPTCGADRPIVRAAPQGGGQVGDQTSSQGSR